MPETSAKGTMATAARRNSRRRSGTEGTIASRPGARSGRAGVGNSSGHPAHYGMLALPPQPTMGAANRPLTEDAPCDD